jgi:hypothetical protein
MYKLLFSVMVGCFISLNTGSLTVSASQQIPEEQLPNTAVSPIPTLKDMAYPIALRQVTFSRLAQIPSEAQETLLNGIPHEGILHAKTIECFFDPSILYENVTSDLNFFLDFEE